MAAKFMPLPQQLDLEQLTNVQNCVQQFVSSAKLDEQISTQLLQVLESELNTCKTRFGRQNDYNQQLLTHTKGLEESLQSSKYEIESLVLEKQRLEMEKKRSELETNLAVKAKQDLMQIVSERNEQISSLQQTVAQLKNELIQERVSKSQVLERENLLDMREQELVYKEKALFEEKNFDSQRISQLTENYEKTVLELHKCECKLSQMSFEHKSSMDEARTDIKRLTADLEACRSQLSKKEEQNNVLMIRLNEMEQHRQQCLEHFNAEVNQLNKLIELQKRQNSLLEDKLKSMQDDNDRLKQLRDTCNKAELELEQQLSQLRKKFVQQIQAKDDEAAELKDQIRLLTQHIHDLDHNQIQNNLQLHYPTSNAMSKIIQNNIPISLIYTEYEKLQKRFDEAQQHIRELNSALAQRSVENDQMVLQQIVIGQDMSQKPVEPYNRLYSIVSKLMNDYENSLEEADAFKKQATALKNECQRFEKSNVDLSRQVRILMRNLCQVHGRMAYDQDNKENMSTVNEPESQRFITQNLVTFRSIEELQERNQQLLASLRQMCQLNEELEKSSCNKYLEEMETLSSKVDKLEEERRRNQELIAEFVNQKDANRKSSSENGFSNKYRNCSRAYLEKKLDELEERLKDKTNVVVTLQKEYEEKTNELNRQVTALEQKRLELKIKTNDLSSQLQNANFKIRSLNSSVQQSTHDNLQLKDHSSKLAERLKICQEDYNKLRQDLSDNRKELRAVKTELSKTKSENERLKSLDETRQEQEATLEEELRKKTNQLFELKQNLESLRNTMEMNQTKERTENVVGLADVQRQLSEQNMELVRVANERDQLRSQLNEKEEHLKKVTSAANQKLSNFKASKENDELKLNEMRKENKRLSEHIALLEKVNENQSEVESANLIREQQNSLENLERRVHDLSRDLVKSSKEKDELITRLKDYEQLKQSGLEVHAKLGETEHQLVDMQQKLKEAIETLEKKEATLKENNMRMKILRTQLDGKINRLEQDLITARDALVERDRRIKQLDEQLQSHKQELSAKSKEILNPSSTCLGSSSSTSSTASSTIVTETSATVLPVPPSLFASSSLNKSTPTASIRPLAVSRLAAAHAQSSGTSTATVAVIQPSSETIDSSKQRSTSSSFVPRATIQPIYSRAHVTTQNKFESTSESLAYGNVVQQTSSIEAEQLLNESSNENVSLENPLPSTSSVDPSRSFSNEETTSKRALTTDNNEPGGKRVRTNEYLSEQDEPVEGNEEVEEVGEEKEQKDDNEEEIEETIEHQQIEPSPESLEIDSNRTPEQIQNLEEPSQDLPMEEAEGEADEIEPMEAVEPIIPTATATDTDTVDAEEIMVSEQITFEPMESTEQDEEFFQMQSTSQQSTHSVTESEQQVEDIEEDVIDSNQEEDAFNVDESMNPNLNKPQSIDYQDKICLPTFVRMETGEPLPSTFNSNENVSMDSETQKAVDTLVSAESAIKSDQFQNIASPSEPIENQEIISHSKPATIELSEKEQPAHEDKQPNTQEKENEQLQHVDQQNFEEPEEEGASAANDEGNDYDSEDDQEENSENIEHYDESFSEDYDEEEDEEIDYDEESEPILPNILARPFVSNIGEQEIITIDSEDDDDEQPSPSQREHDQHPPAYPAVVRQNDDGEREDENDYAEDYGEGDHSQHYDDDDDEEEEEETGQPSDEEDAYSSHGSNAPGHNDDQDE